jgi:transposase
MLTLDEIGAVFAQGPAAVLRLVGQLQEQLIGQQQTIADLTTQATTQRQTIADLTTQATTQRQTIVDLTAQAATQQQTITDLAAQLGTLQQRIGRNSRNSHQPPSADGPATPARSGRGRSARRPGGQPGHPGRALRFSAHPDRLVVHRPACCEACGHDLAAAPVTLLERHQVVDLPPLALETVEHQTVYCTCPACGATSAGTFPPEADEMLSYGPRLAALGVYLTSYQLLPYARASQLLADLFGAGPSPGTLYQAGQRAAARLEPAEQLVRARLLAEPVAHFDETGINIGGGSAWLHVASTAGLTLYGAHSKRGRVAMDAQGVLPGFAGTAVHDSYASYRGYNCQHALCNAHLLRELQAVYEGGQQGWARRLQHLLVVMKRAAERARAAGESGVAEEAAGRYRERYRALLAAGLARNPRREGRGRVKQSQAYNLLVRMREQEEAVLRFMSDVRVPFDNNQAERDLRMVKVQQKIGGCFRSRAGAAGFCRVRGYISTLRKQGAGVLGALEQVFRGNPVVLCLA